MASEAPADWRSASLGDVLELKRGYDLPTRLRTPGPIPIISSSGPSGWHNESKVKGPGVVTGRYGTVGEVYYVDGDFWPLNTALYVRNFKGSNPKFVSYFLKTIQWSKFTDKAAVPGVNRNHVHMEPVVFPPLDEQRRIAAVLGALDDKIELNRKMNRTLEEMAQAIYKSWFIDFDGVPDSEMVESELGPIPKGWEVKPLSAFMELAYGKSLPKKKRVPGPVPVYGSGGVGGYHKEALVEGPGIIVGRKGSVGTVYWEEEPFFPIDTTFYVKPTLGDQWLPWIFFHLDRMDIKRLGADSAVPGVNRHTLLAQKWAMPPIERIEAFLDLRAPIRSRMQANKLHSRTLADLRDALLPKLISGEIRVPEAEGAVEAAL